jgi:hypothetical protein
MVLDLERFQYTACRTELSGLTWRHESIKSGVLSIFSLIEDASIPSRSLVLEAPGVRDGHGR